jgi:tRNA dimethylallyltransferase
MLSSKDEAYANQINQLDEQRIIRALEVIDISGKPLSAQLGLKNKMCLSDKFNIHQYGILEDDRSLLHSRIEDRLNKIIDAGLVDEVNSLLKKYDIPENHPLRKSVNYKQAIARINNEYDDGEFFNRALFATRQLAKRQMTWLRSWKDIKKFKIDSREKIKEDVESLVSSL